MVCLTDKGVLTLFPVGTIVRDPHHRESSTHNKLGKKVHWLLCKKFEIECEDKCFSDQPEPVLENDKCKILWGFAIQTDKEIEQRRPDIVVIDKETRECKIIDIAVPGNQNIKVKELEKITTC